MLMGHIEIVVSMLSAGKGIGAACMLTEELAVLILLWVLFRSQEQHMFTKVCQTWDVHWVRQWTCEYKKFIWAKILQNICCLCSVVFTDCTCKSTTLQWHAHAALYLLCVRQLFAKISAKTTSWANGISRSVTRSRSTDLSELLWIQQGTPSNLEHNMTNKIHNQDFT